MNFSRIVSPKVTSPNYNCDTLQGNWYEDRCISDYDKRKKSDFLLSNPRSWQYDKTSHELGKNWNNFSKTNERFSGSSDNIINFQEKDNNMYITTTRNSYDSNYRNQSALMKQRRIESQNYYQNKIDELQNYRTTWTKRSQNFETTYKADILTRAASSLINNK